MYWYHFDGLLSPLLVALHPFSFVYCYVINQQGRWLWLSAEEGGGGGREQSVLCVFRAMTL